LRAAPRTDPYSRNYLIRLLPRVKRSHRQRRWSVRLVMRPAVSGSVSGARPTVKRFPSSIPFPPRTPPLPMGQSCSPASSVLRDRQTPRKRACRPTAFGAFAYRPASPRTRESPRSPGSRTWSFQACTGSATPRRCRTARDHVVLHVAFPISGQGRHADLAVFGAQWLACLCPCPTLHPRPHGRRRMTRGLDGSLLLSSTALSSATPCRFIPALSHFSLNTTTRLGMRRSKPAAAVSRSTPTGVDPRQPRL
jgi:hypothetical protein